MEQWLVSGGKGTLLMSPLMNRCQADKPVMYIARERERECGRRLRLWFSYLFQGGGERGDKEEGRKTRRPRRGSLWTNSPTRKEGGWWGVSPVKTPFFFSTAGSSRPPEVDESGSEMAGDVDRASSVTWGDPEDDGNRVRTLWLGEGKSNAGGTCKAHVRGGESKKLTIRVGSLMDGPGDRLRHVKLASFLRYLLGFGDPTRPLLRCLLGLGSSTMPFLGRLGGPTMTRWRENWRETPSIRGALRGRVSRFPKCFLIERGPT